MTDDLGKDLHDRATRGESLLPEEQRQLEAWYAGQDAVEARDLSATGAQNQSLEAQVRSTLGQIMRVTQQLQESIAENAALREEIATLRLQLAEQSAP